MTDKAKLFRLKVWTGPTQVKEFAEAFRKAGAIDVFDGTEHVYFTCAGDTHEEARCRFTAGLGRVLGTTFGIQPYDIRPIRDLDTGESINAA